MSTPNEINPAVAQSSAKGATLTGGLGDRDHVIALLNAVARAAYNALDDSEEVEGDDGRCHQVDSANFDALSAALEALDEFLKTGRYT